MKIIRSVLGKLILALDALFSPTPMMRSAEGQKRVDEETRSLVLYQLTTCPFCVKVRRQMKRLALKVEMKEVGDASVQAELMAGGKIDQVPCLKITHGGDVQWMYESDVINAYLSEKFQAIN